MFVVIVKQSKNKKFAKTINFKAIIALSNLDKR